MGWYTDVQAMVPPRPLALMGLALLLPVLPAAWAPEARPARSSPRRLLTAPVDGETNPFEDLPPLKKRYYSDPEARAFNLTDPVIRDYARIVGSLTLDVEFDRWEQDGQRVANAVEILAGVNGTLALYWTPWLFRTPGSDPPAPGVPPLPRPFPSDAPPTYRGPEEAIELASFTEQVSNVTATVAETNARLGSRVEISAVLFDQERFYVNESQPLSSEWNLAIDRKNDLFYNASKRLLPNATVEWYYRGGYGRAASPNGWAVPTWFTLNERGDSYAVALYSVPELGYTRQKVNLTISNAMRHGSDPVTAWLSLCGGYRTDFLYDENSFDFEWDWDRIYSWKMGYELDNNCATLCRDRYADYDKVKTVVFCKIVMLFMVCLLSVSLTPKVSLFQTRRCLTSARRPTPTPPGTQAWSTLSRLCVARRRSRTPARCARRRTTMGMARRPCWTRRRLLRCCWRRRAPQSAP